MTIAPASADDGTTSPAGVTPPPSAPPTPAPVAASAPAPEPETEPPARTYTAAEYREVVSEARNLRARLRETEQTAGQHGAALEAARAEAETLRGQLAAAHDALRGYRLRDAIAETAREDGADDLRGLDPELAARLIEGVEYGEDGAPKGLGPALRRLLKRYPQIAGAAPPRVPPQPPAGRRPAGAGDADVAAQKRRQFGTIL